MKKGGPISRLLTSKTVLALTITFALVAAQLWFGILSYEINDDIYITAILKGLFGFETNGNGVFISPLLSLILFKLYDKFSEFQFFSFIIYIGVVLSFFLTQYTILKLKDTTQKIITSFGIVIFILPSVLRISFTATCLLLWISATAFLFYAIKENEDVGFFHHLASFQLALAYLLRPGLYPLFFLFSLPLILVLISNKSSVSFYKFFFPLFLCFVINFGVFYLGKNDVNIKFQEFNRIRAEFTDTSRSAPTAKTNMALFSVGWTYDDYVVTKNWWLHEKETFNIESVEKFLTINSGKEEIFKYDSFLYHLKDYATEFFIAIFWGLIVFFFSKKSKQPIFYLLAFCVFILSISILMGIRFPARIAYPCFFALLLNGSLFWKLESKGVFYDRLLLGGVSLAFLIAFSLVFFPNFEKLVSDYRTQRQTKKYIDGTINNILEINGKNTIIVDINPHVLPMNYFPFEENDAILKTPILATGWLVGSSTYYKQIKELNLGDRRTLVNNMIDNKRVVLRFWDSRILPLSGYVYGPFLRHLRHNYSPTINLEILRDFRFQGTGLVYLRITST